MRRDEIALREQVVRVCRLMYDKGFISASDGNVSAQLGSGRFLITPSGLHKGFLDADQLLIIDDQGRRVGSSTAANRDLKPTSELPMHLEAYRLRPDVGAVVHAHPPITIALSIAGIPLADCLLPEVVVFLGLIPTTEYATPSSEENVAAIRDLLAGHDALVLQRHGTLTVGRDPMQGFMRLETVEQSSRIAFMLVQLDAVQPLPPEEVRKLLEQREALGLSRPGDAAAFCEVCGVCHVGDNHAPTLRPGQVKGKRPASIGPQALPPIGRPEANADAIRELVAQVVQKTLGNA